MWPNTPFLSTLSLRRATRHRKGETTMIIISIHALLAESDGIGYIAVLNTDISIHALLAESDLQSRSPMILLQISIHALLAESDLCRAGYTKDDLAFLSTLSLRRATVVLRAMRTGINHFYPRSPCGERPWQGGRKGIPTTYFYPRSPCGERCGVALLVDCGTVISIHALLAESDHFLPAQTRPCHISIHALLAESDLPTGTCTSI